jgi:hypothetical protein
MSWRIATDAEANRSGAADFTIGLDGTVEECVEQSWNHEPLKVWYSNEDSLREFLDGWCKHRIVEDVWAFYVVIDGERYQIGSEHPTLDQLMAALKWN